MKFSKILALLLALLMVCALLCACTPADDNGKKDDTTKSDGKTDPTTDVDPDCPELSAYKGEDFEFIGGMFFPKTLRDYTEEEMESEDFEAPVFSVTEQAQADRALTLENKFGIKLVAASFSYDMTGADLAMALAAGELNFDVFHFEIDDCRDWFLGGAVEALENFDKYIDLTDSDKWGSDETLMATTYKGVIWGSPWHGSAYSPCPYICYGQLMVNLETFEQFDTDWTVQELDEQQMWTYDKFLEILPEISNTDEANKIFGFQYTPEFGVCAVYANGGGKVVYDNAKGKYVYGLTSDNAKVAIEWAGEVAASYQYADANTSVSPFLKGGAVIAMMNPNRIFGDVFSTTTDVQFVPFPYGPNVEYGSVYTTYYTYNDSAAGIFKKADEQRMVATSYLFNALSEPLELLEDGGDYHDWLYRNTFGKDAEGENTQAYSYEVYKANGHNIRWSYTLELGAVDTSITNTLAKLSFTAASEVISTLASFEDQANNAIDAEVNP